MAMKNRYSRRAKISAGQFREILKLFAVDANATQIANLTGLNRNTINRYLKGIRKRVAEDCERKSPFCGAVEVDESYFGARRVKGLRGRGAYGKTIVFGILERNGIVHTEIVPDCSKATLQAVIRGRVSLSAVIHSDSWRGYNGLVDLGYKKHFRVSHGNNEFVKGKAHINGIESFWAFAKTRLAKFRGMNKDSFYLHLKECEFRFNYRADDLYDILLKMAKQYPLF
jgi:transposase